MLSWPRELNLGPHEPSLSHTGAGHSPRLLQHRPAGARPMPRGAQHSPRESPHSLRGAQHREHGSQHSPRGANAAIRDRCVAIPGANDAPRFVCVVPRGAGHARVLSYVANGRAGELRSAGCGAGSVRRRRGTRAGVAPWFRGVPPRGARRPRRLPRLRRDSATAAPASAPGNRSPEARCPPGATPSAVAGGALTLRVQRCHRRLQHKQGCNIATCNPERTSGTWY